MITLSENLNFSSKNQHEQAIKIYKCKNELYYIEMLILYCTSNNISLRGTTRTEFDGVIIMMIEYDRVNLDTDHYYFWLT